MTLIAGTGTSTSWDTFTASSVVTPGRIYSSWLYRSKQMFSCSLCIEDNVQVDCMASSASYLTVTACVAESWTVYGTNIMNPDNLFIQVDINDTLALQNYYGMLPFLHSHWY